MFDASLKGCLQMISDSEMEADTYPSGLLILRREGHHWSSRITDNVHAATVSALGKEATEGNKSLWMACSQTGVSFTCICVLGEDLKWAKSSKISKVAW